MKQLKSWSFSSLMNYERCPHSVEPGSIDYNRPRPEAAQRGIDVHKQIEDYLTTQRDLTPKPFDLPFENIINPVCEEKWTLNDKWEPTTDRPWLIYQNDAHTIDTSLSLASLYDWKTGKRNGNEVKHTQQMHLGMCIASIKYPLIQNFNYNLWYVDLSIMIPSKTFTKDQLNPIAQRWDKRGKRMMADTTFEAKPSKSNCRFCDRAKAQGGNCEFEYES